MKKQKFVNIIVMVAMSGLAQTAFGNAAVSYETFSASLASQDLAVLPVGSILIFNEDYTSLAAEDMSFTPACHFEPGSPFGLDNSSGDVTSAGTVFVMEAPFDYKESSDGETEIKLVINGKSTDGKRGVTIHCDRTNLPAELLDKSIEEKGLSIGAVTKGLKEKQIDLVVEHAGK